MSLCIGVLSTILRYHLNTAISCAPVMFTALGNILFINHYLLARAFNEMYDCNPMHSNYLTNFSGNVIFI